MIILTFHQSIFAVIMSSSTEYRVIWDHFKRRGDTAVCSLCKKAIKCTGGSTNGLLRDLEGLHKMKQVKPDEPPAAKNPRTVASFCSAGSRTDDKRTLLQIVAKPAAKDGFTPSRKSDFIRQCLLSRGLHLPKCHTAVMRLVHGYAALVKENLTAKICSMQTERRKFSICIDE